MEKKKYNITKQLNEFITKTRFRGHESSIRHIIVEYVTNRQRFIEKKSLVDFNDFGEKDHSVKYGNFKKSSV